MDNNLQYLMDAGVVQTVGDIIGDSADEGNHTPPLSAALAGLEGMPPFPQPGIYFGMPEADYHAVFALSASGTKKMHVSPVVFWAASALNPGRQEQESEFLTHGKAFHCRIMEGASEYAMRFAIALDQGDVIRANPGAKLLVSTDDIKNAIAAHSEVTLDKKTGGWVDTPVKPVSKVPADPDDPAAGTRAARKEDWIRQLLALQPDAMIWDDLVASHLSANSGRTFVTIEQDRQVQIAARMIERHPELCKAFAGGYPEVSVFWFCPRTGCPMKARFDYLKLRTIVDLKSFGNPLGKPLDRAIGAAIASGRYNLQHAIYLEAAAEAKRLIREHGEAAIHGDVDRDWLMRWSREEESPEFLFVFQMTGGAPLTRGRYMPRGSIYTISQDIVRVAKQRFVECVTTYGIDPWLDEEPIVELSDEDLPMWAVD